MTEDCVDIWEFRWGYIGLRKGRMLFRLYMGAIFANPNNVSRNERRWGVLWGLLPKALVPGRTYSLRGRVKTIDAGEVNLNAEMEAVQ